MAQVDPNQFVIARKRKKYRFALFANAPNCFELDAWQNLHQDSPSAKWTVEVGAGTALFSVELAARYPERSFIALDVKADRLQKGAHEAMECGLDNIYFVRARADQLLDVVKPSSVHEIWLTFSDPFPKKRDAKRRLSSPVFLKLYGQALLPQGVVKMKTDSHELFDWSLEQFVANGWRVQELSYDLHDSVLSNDYKIMTTYEQKWLGQGLTIYYLSASL